MKNNIKIAILNANSFGLYYPKYIQQIENEIGEVTRLTVEKNCSADELYKLLYDYTHIVIGTTPVLCEKFFNSMSKLKLVMRFGIGYDNIDISAANKNSIMVSNIPAVLEREDVAEFAVSLTLSAAKKIVFSANSVLSGEWNKDRGRYLGRRINKKVVGVCGFGNIGSRYAKIMKTAFDCEILAYDPYLTEEQIREKGGKKVDLQEILKQSEIISLHMNLSDNNNELFNRKIFQQMGKKPIIVNTSRGGLINELDLVDAINNGSIAMYATDVITAPPPSKEYPLLNHPNIIITPHISAYNWECNEMMCESIIDDIKRSLQNLAPKHQLFK